MPALVRQPRQLIRGRQLEDSVNAKLPPSPLLEGERLAALQADLDALGKEARANTGLEDLAHYQRMQRIGRIASVVGWSLAWIPNPLSVFLISLGRFMRWTMVAHHTSHGGYRSFKAGWPELDPKAFATGWRRVVDWLDWIEPAAWHHEHDILHHYKLNELEDPDLVEENLAWLRDSGWPMWSRYAFVFVGASIWRWGYYAPNTLRFLDAKTGRRAKVEGRFTWHEWDPTKARFWRFFALCLAPFIAINFVLLPLLFLPLGWGAVASAVVTSLLAEWLCNLHTFMIIVPNHAGEDLWRFDKSTTGRGDFYQRQILGSANYRTGGDANDILHGWLNYQIEHHIWPDLSMLQYQRIAPKAREICEKHGLPYIQESAWVRLRKCVDIMVGNTSMQQAIVPERASAPQAEAAR